MQPRDIAQLVDSTFHDHVKGWEYLRGHWLLRVVATSLAESQGDAKAWNDNTGSDGKVLSRDVGLFEINIPASHIGGAEEKKLYDPAYNTVRAAQLFDTRKLQPWAGYTSGWAMFPECWYYTHLEPHHWTKSGRFLHRALAGVTNYEASRLGVVPIPAVMPRYSREPTEPPADGIGPRPRPCDGHT